MEIQMGKGEWLFSRGTAPDGRKGLLIQKAKEHYAFGEHDLEAPCDVVMDDTKVFIAVPNLESLAILNEQLALLGLDLAGLSKPVL